MNVVNSYKYLGIDFSTKFSFVNCTTSFIMKAKKIIELLKLLDIINCCTLDIFLKLFDSKVLPMLSYGCELWGVQDITGIERVRTFGLKGFFNVSSHCQNYVFYGDTGRYPLYICHKIRVLKYWFRLLKMSMLSEKGHHNWVTDERDLLCMYGFVIVWMCKEVGSEKLLVRQMKERLIDCYKQHWHTEICNNQHMMFYSSSKSQIQPERFLNNKCFRRSLRNALIKMRLGDSQINCHPYKFSRNKTLLNCPFCTTEEENEFHILFFCPFYKELHINTIPSKCMSKRNKNTLSILITSNSISVPKFVTYETERVQDE